MMCGFDFTLGDNNTVRLDKGSNLWTWQFFFYMTSSVATRWLGIFQSAIVASVGRTISVCAYPHVQYTSRCAPLLDAAGILMSLHGPRQIIRLSEQGKVDASDIGKGALFYRGLWDPPKTFITPRLSQSGPRYAGHGFQFGFSRQPCGVALETSTVEKAGLPALLSSETLFLPQHQSSCRRTPAKGTRGRSSLALGMEGSPAKALYRYRNISGARQISSTTR